MSVPLALQLAPINKTSGADARGWATWRFAPPAMPRYQPGAKFITGAACTRGGWLPRGGKRVRMRVTEVVRGRCATAGTNRRFVLAPLGNLVDERYTVYFHLEMPAPESEEAAAAS